MMPVFLPAVAPPMMEPMTNTSTVCLPLVPGHWTLDTNHSSVSFSIRHLGVSKVRGRFTEFEVALDVGSTLESSSLTATIDLASVDTGNTDRDTHLRSPDLIHVAMRPTMTFRSIRIRPGDGTDWTVEGEVTIGDVTQPLVLDVEFGGIESFPGGGPRHAGFEATGELRRKAFGIDLAMPPGIGGAMLGDIVKFNLDIQLLEPETTSSSV
jgi:polyisoprenoid-binding protein YceI